MVKIPPPTIPPIAIAINSFNPKLLPFFSVYVHNYLM